MLSNDEHGMIETTQGHTPLNENTEKTPPTHVPGEQPKADADAEDAVLSAQNDAADSSSEEERMLENSNVFQMFKKLTSEEDDVAPHRGRTGLAFILGGDMLGGKWFKRQLGFIFVLILLMLVYVSNRYICQQEMKESQRLHEELLDRRYKALTRSSQLKEKMLRSNIEQSLLDSTLQTATTPPFILKVE